MKKTKLFMDTVVQIEIVIREEKLMEEAKSKLDQAFEMFRMVEHACSRFSPESELMQACRVIKKTVQISPILFEPLKFAMEIAKLTNGEFDPTIGKTMEEQGFNRHYLTDECMDSDSDPAATFKDIILDEKARTLYLERPLVIDLGAVAKGFAIDLAANELKEFEGFVINAGGDLFVGGYDWNESPWKIGIQHPKNKDQIIDEVEISNEAICTSGSYERRNAKDPRMHHIMNPKTKNSPNVWVSCSVIAPFAMMADAFSTAAFLLGEKGEKLIEDVGLTGKLITPELKIVSVGGNHHDNTEMA
jgi:thiamine biosynthesis lipoprotein